MKLIAGAGQKGHEGSHVTQFIRRISANKNKRFILTSRSTILNQGKFLIDNFYHDNLQRNEYELHIQSLTDLDKAQILYNHIWHSSLGLEYVEQLYYQRRYRDVISHRNFNPRLISYVTDAGRLETCPPTAYWRYITESLSNPSQIWENPFMVQQDDFARAIIFLVVLNGGAIEENVLGDSYRRYLTLPENQNFQGRHEFQSTLRMLTGSFLNRAVSPMGPSRIDLFNPSIGDYVLGRYMGDIAALRLGMLSLRTLQSLVFLRSLTHNKQLALSHVLGICSALVNDLVRDDFDGIDVPYVSCLCEIYRECGGHGPKDSPALKSAVLFIFTKGVGEATSDSFRVVEWAIVQQTLTPEQGLYFIAGNIEILDSDDGIRSVASLLSAIPVTTLSHPEHVELVKEHVVELIMESFADHIDIFAAFSYVDYGEYRAAEDEVVKLIEAKLRDLGIFFHKEDVERILEPFDVVDQLDRYFDNSGDGNDGEPKGPAMVAIDEIDDLFERS